MSALTKTEQNRSVLASMFEREREYVETVITVDKIDDFRANYLELAQNGYLMEQIPPKEVLITAVNATALGVNVNPIYKEAYILPFNVKGKGMVASIVIPKQGHIQMAFQAGFFLHIENVWSINGSTKIESEMTYDELSLIKTTDINFVKEHLIGWQFVFEDISYEAIKVPTQKKFVGLEFALAATKQLQTQEFSIQTWVHKAVRRAMGEMFIPRHRKNMMLENIENWNNKNEDGTSSKEPTAEPIDPLSKPQEEYTDAEIEATVTLDDVKALYMDATAEHQARMGEIFQKRGNWRAMTDKGEIKTLYDEVKAVKDEMVD